MQAYTAFIKPRDLEWHWRTFGEYLDYLEANGVYLNTVPLAARHRDGGEGPARSGRKSVSERPGCLSPACPGASRVGLARWDRTSRRS